MLQDFARKCKFYARIIGRREDFFVVLIILLVGFGSFGLGQLSAVEERDKEPILLEYTTGFSQKNTAQAITTAQKQGNKSDSEQTPGETGAIQGTYVASKNGSIYHHPWCPGALKIKEENKRWFNSKEEAEKAGFTPAKNCKGL